MTIVGGSLQFGVFQTFEVTECDGRLESCAHKLSSELPGTSMHPIGGSNAVDQAITHV